MFVKTVRYEYSRSIVRIVIEIETSDSNKIEPFRTFRRIDNQHLHYKKYYLMNNNEKNQHILFDNSYILDNYKLKLALLKLK